MSTKNLSVQQWPITRPIPYARNARVCPEAAIAKVAGSIHQFGFRNPILVDGESATLEGDGRSFADVAAERLP